MYMRAFAFLIFCTTISFAQDVNKENEILITDQDKFITLLQINNIEFQGRQDFSSIATGTNTVFIQQIGANNSAISNIVAESSDINIFQNGNENKVEIEESAREIEKLITQTGNNNIVYDFSFNPNASTSLELIQEGDNLIFERFGTNELSKNLKFKMTGEARTIIVRSF
ncbi:hypothetical protein [Aquimarina celericrescens]|uniref:Curlin associated repeat-containing protein n=1 Tax=Aquimarina celericrescens TaxID=1964542 RepID=A0ABW5AZK6_9FLAO